MGIRRTEFKIFMTQREKEVFKKLAESNGLSLSAMIRFALFEKTKKEESIKKF